MGIHWATGLVAWQLQASQGSQVAGGPLELPKSSRASSIFTTRGLSAAQEFQKPMA